MQCYINKVIRGMGFPSKQRYLSSFYYLFLGRMTETYRGYLQMEMSWKLTRLTTDSLFFRIFVILVVYGDRLFPVTVNMVAELTIWCAAVVLRCGLC
jgi:hypothetical protein